MSDKTVEEIMDRAYDWLYCNNEENDIALKAAISALAAERDRALADVRLFKENIDYEVEQLTEECDALKARVVELENKEKP